MQVSVLKCREIRKKKVERGSRRERRKRGRERGLREAQRQRPRGEAEDGRESQVGATQGPPREKGAERTPLWGAGTERAGGRDGRDKGRGERVAGKPLGGDLTGETEGEDGGDRRRDWGT